MANLVVLSISWLDDAILSSNQSTLCWVIFTICVPSKPSIVFWPQNPFYSQPNYSSWWLGICWGLEQLVPVHRNNGVAAWDGPQKKFQICIPSVNCLFICPTFWRGRGKCSVASVGAISSPFSIMSIKLETKGGCVMIRKIWRKKKQSQLCEG